MTPAEKTAPLTSEMLDLWMATYKTMRQDGDKVLEVMVSQAKSNVEEMNRTMQSALDAVPAWDALTMGDLRRRMDELAKRVDALSSK